MSGYPPPPSSSSSPQYSSPSSRAASSTGAEAGTEAEAEAGAGAGASPAIVHRRRQTQTPTIGALLRSAAINLFLPFVNGLMLGFGELFAHEIAWRWGWGGTRVFPRGRTRKVAAPGI